MTDQVRRARQALGARDRGVRAIREFCRDREFFVATDLDKLERFFCHDWVFYVATELANEGKFLSRRNVIMSRQSWPTWGEILS